MNANSTINIRDKKLRRSLLHKALLYVFQEFDTLCLPYVWIVPATGTEDEVLVHEL